MVLASDVIDYALRGERTNEGVSHAAALRPHAATRPSGLVLLTDDSKAGVDGGIGGFGKGAN